MLNQHKSDSLVKYAWLCFTSNCLLMIWGAYMKIYDYPGYKETLTAGILLLPVLWGLIIFDILKNSILNKPFWLISVFAFGNIGPLIYLVRRDSLLNMNK